MKSNQLRMAVLVDPPGDGERKHLETGAQHGSEEKE
jgi:hypothetical protein